MEHHHITAEHLSVGRVREILERRLLLALSDDARARIVRCREYLDRKMENPERPIYGITSGFGSLCDISVGRDHHDVSGTDSPYRETSNIYDGSNLTADMAVQNVIGDAFRGATWVSIHNGGGVGWGEVINGGFGMVIDGSEASDRRIREMLLWDVNNGIARRSWARIEGAVSAIRREMERTPGLQVTLPNAADEERIRNVLKENE